MTEVVSGEDGGEDGRRPEDGAGKGVVGAFGQTLKTLRLREGLDRGEFGNRIGYSAATIASFEQGRRIPSPATIDRADEVLGAGGLLCLWKEEVERAQYPVFFQGMATLEKEAVELLSYDTLVVKGLLQTEEYMRALLTMRRPVLDPETIEQRVAARLARQDIFDRWPAPLLSFVMDESVLRRPYGGAGVQRGQLEHLLLMGQKPNVVIQVMPLSCEESAGVDGPFTIVTRKDGMRFVYMEAQGTSTLQTDPAQTTLAAARYGIIRSQTLTSRESLKFIEGLLASL
ncbi:helix-turn-helix domain-containing protein [Streptomyces olivaceus]|uniref:Helix-turn-helix domain-containing protein n=1 Tax=Streptomyces olivaceus TaxID=47716 RepID=A0ABS7W9P1_STROV|nr:MULTISPECIES: helix-turn-helix transcriptional regulator [Streptomyces]MBZ6089148.1 helix-turn-helix domain-containing protein [Streptomyces olivaceus]MBZ6097286.1 helix-turn-helix domain-containing protein [Streptomyces olivaceus]MBZ6120742.1 helix-turn-helix domain-containing protein [Streptomyces olivaceus]MBZ6154664.1 helix-turn-helix domain-containing protein [Streptomyces olivaceus]MBZ6301996.1 helix-turn-helix domain-containing protein [Streptomyces olivaceus]